MQTLGVCLETGKRLGFVFPSWGGCGRVGGGMCREKEPLRKPLAGSRARLCCARGVSRPAGAMTEHLSPPLQGTSAAPGPDLAPAPRRALGGGLGGAQG